MRTKTVHCCGNRIQKRSGIIAMQDDTQYFEIVIIGTGFSGLLAAIREGKKELLMLEAIFNANICQK